MAGGEHIKGKGVRFSSTNQPKKNGRKPSLFKQMKELALLGSGVELSREDFSKITALLLTKSASELKAMQEAEDTPIWVVNIARAIIKDSNAGRIVTLDSLLDRLFGRATQPTQQTIDVELKGSIPIRKWVEDRLEK